MRLGSHNVCPPGGWVFRFSDGFHIREHGAWDYFKRRVAEVAKIRALPPPTTQQIEQFICEALGPDAEGWCFGDEPGAPPIFAVHDCAKVDFGRMLSTTRLLVDAMSGGGIVDDVEAERRATICADCTQNRDIPGCLGCSAGPLTELATRAAGAKRLREPLKLRTCCICACWLRTKVWINLDVLERHAPLGQRAALQERAPHCWMLEETQNELFSI
jgi:hypothetical protein